MLLTYVMNEKRNIEFGVFDRKAHTDQHFRKLPHWFQPGVATFITFRTKDSMPKTVVDSWHREIEQWLMEHEVETTNQSELLPVTDSLPKHLRSKYNKMKSQGWHERLDHCLGSCPFRDQDLAAIVSDTLKFFDGDRYDLASFVIMPNHVHVLVQFRAQFNLKKQTASWLRFSAREINRQLNLTGPFWQSEPFDHLIRSEEQFFYLSDYIRDNPKKAGLASGEYLYYER